MGFLTSSHIFNQNHREFNRFNHHEDFFHLTASESWSHLNISSYQMGQETPIFMLHSRLPIQIIQFLPRNRRVFPPFFPLRRGIGTAPVAVTISLRATPAAGNVVLPETPGQLSFNYGSSGDPGIPPLFNFISTRKKAVTWAQHMEVSVESRGYPQIIQVIKPFEYWNNHGDDWGSLILRHHDIEKLWKVHPYCINGDLAHAIFDVATHSPATHRVSRSMSSDFPPWIPVGGFPINDSEWWTHLFPQMSCEHVLKFRWSI